jgi:hypothetical protein
MSDFSGSSLSNESVVTNMRHSSSSFEDLDLLEDEHFQWWDAGIQALAIQLLSARVLEGSKLSPP